MTPLEIGMAQLHCLLAPSGAVAKSIASLSPDLCL